VKSILEKIDLWQKDIKEGDNVLDIGCWDGSRLKKLQGNVFGMEIDENKINLAEPKIKKRIKLGDVTKKIPYNKKFNWIFLTEVLEHVSDDSKTLVNINKSLKKKGNLILTTTKSTKYLEFWDPAWVRWKFLGGQKHYHYTKEELFGKLDKNGFKIKEYYIMGNLSWVLVRWVNVFLKYLLKSKKQINYPMKKGFCDWIILSEKNDKG
jgi:2-polyprenyl-3-methyl-5-hydroxy-6-metoxy-1,4-benzoquinol methylase